MVSSDVGFVQNLALNPCHGISFRLFFRSLGVILPAAGHGSDLWERELQKDLLLFVHEINPSPVHCHDHVILGQTGSWRGNGNISMK